MKMIYLDSAATTKPKPEYLELYQKTHLNYWHNSNSPIKPGQKSRSCFGTGHRDSAKALNVPKTTKSFYERRHRSQQFCDLRCM